jgi:hypothetical protein
LIQKFDRALQHCANFVVMVGRMNDDDVEPIALANEKVAHWNNKRDHALAMLTKWQGRLTALQSKDTPQTKDKLPPLTLVPGSVKFMPRSAVRTRGDQIQAESIAKQQALKKAEAEDKAGADAARVVPTVNSKPLPKAKVRATKKH